MKTPELKPCPFCGETEIYLYAQWAKTCIMCGKCLATITRDLGNNEDAMRDAAIAAWNKRTPLEARHA